MKFSDVMSLQEILKPLADKLGVRHVLAANLERVDSVFSGWLIGHQTIGNGKRRAVEAFLQQHGVDSNECFGYGDHLSDLSLLESIDHPRVIEGDMHLEAIAHKRSWLILAATLKGDPYAN